MQEKQFNEQPLTEREIAELRQEFRERLDSGPRFTGASFDPVDGVLTVQLTSPFLSESTLKFAIRKVAGFEDVTDEQLKEFQIGGFRDSIRWSEIGIRFSSEQLVKIAFGLPDDSFKAHQSKAGASKTDAKAAAARANGAKGGRPRKNPPVS